MAVYTDISAAELEAFLNQYSIGELQSFRGIAEGVENSNFLVTTAKDKYILTLYEKRVRSEDLPFFLYLMEHLAAHHLPCPIPVHDKKGEAIQQLKGKNALVVSFLTGKATTAIKPMYCELVGQALANMHLATQSFTMRRDNAMGMSAWKPLLEKCGTNADTLEQGLHTELRNAVGYIETYWPKSLPQGVIHADLFPDNVFFEKEALSGLLDFYFACNDFFAYDLAIALNAWCFEKNGEFNITKAKSLLANYHRLRPLNDTEYQALPILAAGAALRFSLSRLYDFLHPQKGALVTVKDPMEYVKKLRFHLQIQTSSEYGL